MEELGQPLLRSPAGALMVGGPEPCVREFTFPGVPSLCQSCGRWLVQVEAFPGDPALDCDGDGAGCMADLERSMRGGVEKRPNVLNAADLRPRERITADGTPW